MDNTVVTIYPDQGPKGERVLRVYKRSTNEMTINLFDSDAAFDAALAKFAEEGAQIVRAQNVAVMSESLPCNRSGPSLDALRRVLDVPRCKVCDELESPCNCYGSYHGFHNAS
jgi:hypothetical protein